MIYRSGLLAVLLCVQLLVVAGVLYLDAADSASDAGELFLDFSADGVDKIVVSESESQVTLHKRAEGWVVGDDLPADGEKIKGKVLVLHGADDPFVSKENIAAFIAEMNQWKGDWQMVSYSGAVHSFTKPEAGNDPSRGAAYNAAAVHELLDGKQSAYRNAVLLTAAGSLMIADKADNLLDGVKIARDAIDSGAARDCLARLVEIINRGS